MGELEKVISSRFSKPSNPMGEVCFEGESSVTMESGSTAMASELKENR